MLIMQQIADIGMVDYSKFKNDKIDLDPAWTQFCRLMSTDGITMRGEYKGDPLFVENGKWYFYNESWTETHGPFNTEEEADKACNKYAADLYSSL